MDSSERLHRLFAYDTWACLEVLAVLQDNESFELREEAVKMFAHIVSSQMHWYARITKESSGESPLWPAGDLAKSRKQLVSMKDKWPVLIDNNKDRLDRYVDYENSKGVSYSTMLSDILHHVIIHGQHHRAQISYMLRKSEIVPPPTDFIFYLRKREE